MQPIDVCSGTCFSVEEFIISYEGYVLGQKSCNCCNAIEAKTSEIELTCESIGKVKVQHITPTKCGCVACDSHERLGTEQSLNTKMNNN
jgi:hypothetical protein